MIDMVLDRSISITLTLRLFFGNHHIWFHTHNISYYGSIHLKDNIFNLIHAIIYHTEILNDNVGGIIKLATDD